MEDKLNESTNVRLIFLKNYDFSNADFKNNERPSCISVGEKIALAVIAEYSGIEQKDSQDFNLWLSTVKRLSVNGNLTPTPRMEEAKNEVQPKTSVNDNGDTSKASNICSTFVKGLESCCVCECDLKTDEESRMLRDTSWIIPICLTLKYVPEVCTGLMLSVTVWSGETDYKADSEKKDMAAVPNQSIPSDDKMADKISFSHHLKVSAAPSVDVSLVPMAAKYNIVGKVTNTSHQTVVISDCRILPQDSHWSTRPGEEQEEAHSNQDGSQDVFTSCSNVKGVKIKLRPCERYTFMVQFRQQAISSMEQELLLAVHLTWTNLPPYQESSKSLVTTYLIPKISVRKPPFQVSTSCCKTIQPRKSFSVTYDIANRLQDFLALKLYWSPEKALPLLQDKGSRHQLERLLDSVICHDPSVELGSCPRNTSMSVNVGFQALRTGVFEIGTHMKLNLRYALGNHSNLTSPGLLSPSVTNSDSNATISAEDQLALESENLWRDRSASICSGHSAEQNTLPVTDKRKSFATKSYSFGELGPTGSGDSTEDSAKVRFKKIERSCAVPAARPTALRSALSSPRVGEPPVAANLMEPGNFMKKHCFLYLPSR